MKRDYLGNILNIGDECVFITPRYRTFSKGKILRFTKIYVVLSIGKNEIRQTANQLIKIITERG